MSKTHVTIEIWADDISEAAMKIEEIARQVGLGHISGGDDESYFDVEGSDENEVEESDEDVCSYCGSASSSYECSICQKPTCVNCDTYYLPVDHGYISDPNIIYDRVGTLEGYVAHTSCVQGQVCLDEEYVS